MIARIKMIVFVLVLGSVWTSALVGVDGLTRERIQAHEERRFSRSMLDALNIEYEGKDIAAVFEENVKEVEKNGEKFYWTTDEKAVAFKISGAGSQGKITGVMALSSDLNTIRGIKIVSNSETPGLGDRVLADGHTAKLRGKKLLPTFVVTREGEAQGDSQIDGITGATLTSKALERLLNESAAKYIRILSEDNSE